MLSVVKEKLKIDLQKILYEAYMTQFTTDLEAGNCNIEAQKNIDKAAQKFSEKASGPTSEAIYNFIKEIGITIMIPPSIVAPSLPPSMPGGPCSGTIPISNITIL